MEIPSDDHMILTLVLLQHYLFKNVVSHFDTLRKRVLGIVMWICYSMFAQQHFRGRTSKKKFFFKVFEQFSWLNHERSFLSLKYKVLGRTYPLHDECVLLKVF